MRNILFVVFTLAYFAQLHAETVTGTYTFDHYQISQSGRGYVSFSLDNATVMGVFGEPALPYVPIALAIPFGTKAVGCDIQFSDEVTVPGEVQILPFQGYRIMSQPAAPAYLRNEAVYASNAPYPKSCAGSIRTQYLNGYGIAVTLFTPVRYNPAARRLSFYRTARVTIHTQKADAPVQRRMIHSAPEKAALVKSLVRNPHIIDTYPATRAQNQYDMLIVTTAEYKDSFRDLIDYYASLKLKTKVILTTDITAGGRDVQEKIRNCIIEEYAANKILYVLLGGDVQVIPPRKLTCTMITSPPNSQKVTDDIPADLYFCTLDGNWDKNNNNVFGERADQDSIDLYPDLALGRMCFKDHGELANMIRKNLSYQKEPVKTELNKPLLFGEYLDEVTLSKSSLELLVGHHEEDGYVTDGIPSASNKIDRFYELEEDEINTRMSISKLNEGHTTIYHCGHAWSNVGLKLMWSDITEANFKALDGKNHNYPVIYSLGCRCGGFDHYDCILEHMINLSVFAVTVIGNSRYGIYLSGQTEGPSFHMQREFVNGLYSKNITRIGDAFTYGRSTYVPYVSYMIEEQSPDSGCCRWAYYTVNLLGDPAMTVWYKENQSPVQKQEMNPLAWKPLLRVEKISAAKARITFTPGRPAPVGLSIFNSRGQCVRTLLESQRVAGTQTLTWNGTSANNEPVASGRYFVRLKTPQYIETQAVEIMR